MSTGKEGSGFNTPKENAQVQFEVAQGPKGDHAINIKPA